MSNTTKIALAGLALLLLVFGARALLSDDSEQEQQASPVAEHSDTPAPPTRATHSEAASEQASPMPASVDDDPVGSLRLEGSLSALRDGYPKYVIEKQKLELPDRDVLPMLFQKLEKKYSHCEINKIDGIRIQVNPHEWLHIRGSNTEPIIRIYGESGSVESASMLVEEVKDYLIKMLN